MDYALLAGTALGAVGLFLMLPRDRAPWARLGGLLSGMALIGILLYLLRTAANTPVGAGGGEGPPIYFYLFSFIMIASSVAVVVTPRPVYAALYFVLVTLAGAGLFVLLLAEFMAIVLIIIYAGAILVTYVFVIMLASQGSSGTGGQAVAPEYDRHAASPFGAVLVSFLLVGAVLQVLFPPNHPGEPLAVASHSDVMMRASLQDDIPATKPSDVSITPGAADSSAPTPTAPAVVASTPGPHPTVAPSNVQLLGMSLSGRYALSLELAGILLTIALIGAVVIARKNTAEHAPLGTGQLPAE